MPQEIRDVRDRLRYPVAVCIIIVWLASFAAAIVERDVQIFLIANGPFWALCGYLFTGNIFKRAENGTHG